MKSVLSQIGYNSHMVYLFSLNKWEFSHNYLKFIINVYFVQSSKIYVEFICNSTINRSRLRRLIIGKFLD